MSRADRAVLVRRLRILVGAALAPSTQIAAPRTVTTADDAEAAARVPPAIPDAGAPAAPGGWVPRAVTTAAQEYARSYRPAGGLTAPGWAPADEPGAATDTDLAGAVGTRPARRWRWAVSWRLAAAAVGVVALLVGAVVLRAVALAPGEPVALPVASPVAAPDTSPGAASSAPTAGTVIVHVVGAVARAGVVALPTGSRVIDAVDAAGGANPDADLSAINLARPLVDGEQVVVPLPGEASTGAQLSAAGPAGDSTTNLNTAGAAALDELPGIGPVLAGRIVERRTQRPFSSVDELSEIDGIGPTLLERLRPLVRV